MNEDSLLYLNLDISKDVHAPNVSGADMANESPITYALLKLLHSSSAVGEFHDYTSNS